MAYFLTGGDRIFLGKAMRAFGIKKVRVGWDNSRKTWPDIWCFPNETPPRIVVTREWLRQASDERKKRLTHECLHIVGLEHGRIGPYDFSSHPEKDSYSRMVYQNIVGREK